MAERGVAPARVFRKHASGTSRVAVRPNYVGLPTPGLDEGRTNGAKAPGSGGRRVRCPTPEARPRGAKSPQWSAERRASGDPDARAARRGFEGKALLGAPLPYMREGKGNEGAPRAFQQQGRRSVGCSDPRLFDNRVRDLLPGKSSTRDG